jgi:hypothetical protein
VEQRDLMKTIRPGMPHVVVVEQLDGSVAVQHSRAPLDLLARLGSHVYLGRVEVRPSPRAQAIAERVRDRLPGGPVHEFTWHPADFEQAIELLDEYNLETGLIVQRAGVMLNGVVQVAKHGRGVVTGFTRCGRVMVRLDRPGRAAITAIAPRSQVKPVVRA